MALGDVTGDDVPDVITAPGRGGGPHVKVFDGVSLREVRSFFAYDPSVVGGVWVAAGDVNGDGTEDILTGPGHLAGGPHVKVFDGRTGSELQSFFAYDPAFVGGVIVSAGDTDGDGRAEVVTAAWTGGGPHVKVFDARTLDEKLGFFAYDPGFAGGDWVATGDVTGDGRDEVITAPGTGAAGHVKVFDGASGREHGAFLAYLEPDTGFTGGVRAGTADVTGDGVADLITAAGPAGPADVLVIDGVKINEVNPGGLIADSAVLRAFPPFDPRFTGGAFVATLNVNTRPTFVNRSLTSAAGEGGDVILTGTIVDPDPLDLFHLDVDWGDGVRETFTFGPGADGTAVTVRHAYADDAEQYQVR
ncbi:MAG TPA: hypothetical protein VIL46_05700, partial [Gemmataceae bacterium]